MQLAYIRPERAPAFLGAIVVLFAILASLFGVGGIVQHTIFVVVLAVSIAVTTLIVLRYHSVLVWHPRHAALGLVGSLFGISFLMGLLPGSLTRTLSPEADVIGQVDGVRTSHGPRSTYHYLTLTTDATRRLRLWHQNRLPVFDALINGNQVRARFAVWTHEARAVETLSGRSHPWRWLNYGTERLSELLLSTGLSVAFLTWGVVHLELARRRRGDR